MWKNAWPCRCRNAKCPRFGMRTTLRLAPSQYSPQQEFRGRCQSCGRTLTIDAFRKSGREHRRKRCCCDHYPFPHRRGSLHCRLGAAGQAGFPYWARGTEDFREWIMERMPQLRDAA